MCQTPSTYIFTILCDSHNGEEVLNCSAPYLVRSKLSSSNEAGLSVGFGLLDSLTVVSEETFKKRVIPPPVEQ